MRKLGKRARAYENVSDLVRSIYGNCYCGCPISSYRYRDGLQIQRKPL